MRTDKNIVLAAAGFLLIFLFPTILSGQEDLSPQLPDLILPPFLLELEEQLLVEIEAPLPHEEALGLPPLEMPLPGPEDLRLSPFSADLQIDPGDSRETIGEKPARQRIYTIGKLGAGPGNYILGDLTIHRLEETPRFSLHFFHESRDGFSGAASGEGFSMRQELLEGSFTHARGPVETEGRFSFGEEERGLQGLSVSDSLVLRGYFGEGSYGRRFGAGGLWSLSLKGSSLSRWLAGGPEDRNQIVSYQPALEWGWEWDRLFVFARGGYHYSRLTANGDREDLKQYGLLGAGLSVRLPRGWQADLEAGAAWDFEGRPEYPFEVKLEGPVGRDLALSFQGERVDRPWEADQLRDEFPLLAFEDGTGGAVLPESLKGWRAAGSFTAAPGDRLGLEGRIVWARWENLIQPGISLPSRERSFSQAAADVFEFSLEGRGFINRYLTLFAGWEGQAFLDRRLLYPENMVTLALEIEDRQLSGGTVLPPWGGRLSGAWAVFPRESPLVGQYPVLDGMGYYRITPGGKIMLEISDLLSPFLDEGRLYWDEITNPGLTLSLSVSISL